MKKGFVLSTYVYILLVFFLLLLTTMLIVLNNTKVISKKMKSSVLQNSGVESAFNLVLVGDSTIELIVNDEYDDAGIIATTLDGKDISGRVVTASEVNTEIPGVYEVNYRITYNGKTKIIRRNVVVKKDTGYLSNDWITLGNVDPTKVKSITFYNDNRTLGSGVLVAESGKVMLYKINVEGSDLYDVYIVGNGDVCFPINSSYLFSNTDTSKRFTSLESIDFNNSIDTSFALNMSHMFDGCSKLKNIDLSSFDTINVINMSDMFSNCSSISVLDISNINTSNVVNMNNMFKNDSKLLTIYVGEVFSTNSLSTGTDIFLDCTRLIGGYGDVYDFGNVTYEYAYVGNGGYFTCKEGLSCPVIIRNENSLYNVFETAAGTTGSFVRAYAGAHQDSLNGTGSSDVYYFRANNLDSLNAIDNSNNVLFANQCWQMYRTTDTGGVKMLYNGEAVDNQCLDSRATHAGYTGTGAQTLSSQYYYGTGYTYDQSTKLFTLTGTLSQETWSSSTGHNLVGKYTCKQNSSSGTCSTLYLIESYKSDTVANVLSISNSSKNSQFGTMPYNDYGNSPAHVGYMYNMDNAVEAVSASRTENYGTNTQNTYEYHYNINNTYYYSDSITYNSSTGKYSLVDPYQVDTISNDLLGKYTIFGTSTTSTRANAFYLIKINGSSSAYCKELVGGDTNVTMALGNSITDNGNGTYSLNGVTNVDMKDWYTNYSSYKNKYTCGSSSSTCSNYLYISNTTSTSYTYIDNDNLLIAKSNNGLNLVDTLLVDKISLSMNPSNYSDYKYTCGDTSSTCSDSDFKNITSFTSTGYTYIPNYYFGSSVTWDGSKYTLVSTVGSDKYNNTTSLSSHHYMCTTPGATQCTTVMYIVKYLNNKYYCVTLENGIASSTELLEKMLHDNSVNVKNSNIKTAIDAWYKNYMIPYTDYLDDVIYCNARNILNLGGWDPDGGSVTEDLEFRHIGNYGCTYDTDKFSVGNNKAKLTYPVGLITDDEIKELFYGVSSGSNRNYWGMTAGSFGGSSSPSWLIGGMSSLYSGIPATTYMTSSLGVKPVITLKSGIEYTTGTGTKADPYVINVD